MYYFLLLGLCVFCSAVCWAKGFSSGKKEGEKEGYNKGFAAAVAARMLARASLKKKTDLVEKTGEKDFWIG